MIDQKQVAEWQKKYGEGNLIVQTVTVEEGDVAVGYFFHPDKHLNPYSIYSRVMTCLRKDLVVEAGTLIIQECWLGGDERFKDRNSKVHLSVGGELIDAMGFLAVASKRI